MLHATKTWTCCHCIGAINPGDEFVIREGSMYHAEHDPQWNAEQPAPAAANETHGHTEQINLFG